MKNLILFFLLAGLSIFTVMCTKDNSSNSCDTSNVKYSTDIVPELVEHCKSCHLDGNDQGNVTLDTYDEVKKYVNNGQLLGSVRWDSGFPKMPEGGTKLDDCTVKKWEAWVAAGAPNN